MEYFLIGYSVRSGEVVVAVSVAPELFSLYREIESRYPSKDDGFISIDIYNEIRKVHSIFLSIDSIDYYLKSSPSNSSTKLRLL